MTVSREYKEGSGSVGEVLELEEMSVGFPAA